MIRAFKHKGLQAFFTTGSKAGINPAHASRLALQLATLEAATSPAAMNVPGWKLHALDQDLAGHWSIRVNGNWRVTFVFEGTDAILVDYQDYR